MRQLAPLGLAERTAPLPVEAEGTASCEQGKGRCRVQVFGPLPISLLWISLVPAMDRRHHERGAGRRSRTSLSPFPNGWLSRIRTQGAALQRRIELSTAIYRPSSPSLLARPATAVEFSSNLQRPVIDSSNATRERHDKTPRSRTNDTMPWGALKSLDVRGMQI